MKIRRYMRRKKKTKKERDEKVKRWRVIIE
jgi:hypothetical protein